MVDTNVIAYLLLGTKAFVEEARACFEQVVTPLAPAHWEAELAARTACPLVTFDKVILRAFPDVACRPGELTGR